MSNAATKEKPSYKLSSCECVFNKGGKNASLKLNTKSKNKKTVLPVIYIPGIFASRLQSEDGKTTIWDPDDVASMKLHLINGVVKSVLGIDVYWSDKELDEKAAHLNTPGKVMSRHHDEIIYSVLERIKEGKPFKRLLDKNKLNDWDEDHWELIDKLAQCEYKERAKRGWYEVLSQYADIMEQIWMHEDDNFLYPTFAFGYNWRDNLHNSADPLIERINKILAQTEYPEWGEKDKDYLVDPNQKVILVTHSMGSILARYASEVAGANNKIHSIIHINQPTTGAPVLYRRFLTGTSAEKGFPFPGIISKAKENAFLEVLGNNPYHFTRIAGQMAGAIQLLPTNDHICEETEDKHWLQINHPFIRNKITPKEKQDIYELYKSEAVGLISCKRYDNNGNLKPYTKEEFKWVRYNDMHGDEQDELLTNVDPIEMKDFEDVEEYYPDETPYTKDNYRLRKNKSKTKNNAFLSNDFFKKIKKNVLKAKLFHTKLELKKHKKTFVVSSKGKKTINQVIINLNEKNIVDCPINEAHSELGDGTVPLTSQNALLRDGASNRAGEIITKQNNKVVKNPGQKGMRRSLSSTGSVDISHADMPGNVHAIKQALEKITEVSSKVKPVKQQVS